MKTFKINDSYRIVCKSENTRYGFRHLAELKNQYYETIAKAKVCYYNRTWESFEFETVISSLLQKSKIIPEDQQKQFLDLCRKNELEQVNKQSGFVASIAKLGEAFCDDQKSKNDWKTRMLKAGLPGISFPEDWNELSEDEKEKRLNNVINELQK